MKIVLTTSEIVHILSMIEDNERDWGYYWNQWQYIVRRNRIKEKLNEAINNK